MEPLYKLGLVWGNKNKGIIAKKLLLISPNIKQDHSLANKLKISTQAREAA
jgi:hypothetical protein